MLNLQKQVQEKDDALRDISDKLSRKSEEYESLMEERDIMRSKSSFDLQQVQLNGTRSFFFLILILHLNSNALYRQDRTSDVKSAIS